MQEVSFTNGKGKKITFNALLPFNLGGITGITQAAATAYTDITINRNGERYEKSMLDKKVLTLKVIINAANENEMMNCRRNLIQLFNPLYGEGILTYTRNNTTKNIKAVPESVPDIPYEGNNYKMAVSVDLIAYDPLFYGDSERYPFSTTLGGLEFPLEILAEGFEVDTREVSLIKKISNNGDAPCGVLVVLTAYGAVENPSVSVLEDSISFTLAKTLAAGEIVTIDTSDLDNIKMTSLLNSEETDIMNFFDITSDFLIIEPGDKTIVYGAESGVDNLGMTLEIKPRYIGI